MIKFIELILLFVGVPLILLFTPIRLFLVLGPVGIIILIYLLRSKTFRKHKHFSLKGIKKVLIRFGLLASLITVLTWVLFPSMFFMLPRQIPWLWLLIMIFYPVFSVLPQTIIYRGFFVDRYSDIFNTRLSRILSGAILFSFGHILFANIIALVFTFIGGILFMQTYEDSKSLLLSFIEHSLYGCFVFTVGLGLFFYSGNVQ